MTRAELNSPTPSTQSTMTDRPTLNATPPRTAAPEHVDRDMILGTGAPTSHNLKLTIALAVLGVFVTYVPIPAVSAALTRIGVATGARTADLQWITDAYIIPMAATILSAGVFGDLYGRRRVYLIGMALTAIGTTIAAAGSIPGDKDSLHALWAGQAVTGAGAGLLLPTTLALIAQAVPDLPARARYVAMWSSGLVLGLAVGPLLAGAILEHAAWGWIFAPVTGLALLAGGVAAMWLPESKSPDGRRLDWPGQIAATIAIAASIFGVIEGGQSGWGSPAAVIGLSVGALALVAFVRIEAQSISPMVRLSLFRIPQFSASSLSALIGLFALVGTIFVLSLFFGTGQHLSPLQIGIRLLFINGVTALVNPVVGRLLARFSAIGVLALGLALAALDMFLLTGTQTSTKLAGAAWRLAVLGVADALLLSAVSLAAIAAVPQHLAGMAAATNTALRQYGAALGPAVLGVILANRISHGATIATALHTALRVNGAVLLFAAVVCALTAGLTRKRRLATSAAS